MEMYKKNIQKGASVLLLLSLMACASTELITETSQTVPIQQGQCDFLPTAPQPAWVTGNSQIEDYYTGVGDSDARQAGATQLTRQRALADLSSSIQINVSQQLSIQISENNSDREVQRSLEDQTRSITENSIMNSERDALWLDRQGCRLWMRIKVAKKHVEAIQHKNIQQVRLDLAKQNYQLAVDANQPHITRVEKIEEAIQQINNIDFSVLPLEYSQKYSGKYRQLQLQIISQSGSNHILIVTLADQSVPKSVHKELAYRISSGLKQSKHLYPAPCHSSEDCLQYARSMRANMLIMLPFRTSTTAGDMGSLIGELSIDATLYDVMSGRKLDHMQNQKGQMLSFDVGTLIWGQAIERLFANNTEIQNLKSTTLKCSTQQC